MVTLWHGDCLEKMKDIPDKSVDMILTDPPYGTTACKWDIIIPFEPMWIELKRIIKLPDNSSDDPDFEPFNFRDGPRPRNMIPATKFDRYTFRYFFPRLISKININFSNVEFNSKPEPFKAQISILSKDIQKMFLECFPNFSVTYFTFYMKKKK